METLKIPNSFQKQIQCVRKERWKRGNSKELELISLSNKNSELPREEKSYEKIICKEFFTLPQVFFIESIFE